LLRAQGFLSLLVQLLALPEEAQEEDEEEDEEELVADHLDKLRLVLEMMLLYCSTLSARGSQLFPLDSAAAGSGLTLRADSLLALTAALLPPAAPFSDRPLPTPVVASYLQLLRVLSQDLLTLQSMKAESCRGNIAHFCGEEKEGDAAREEVSAGFRELLLQLSS
jgi:hypothetical protein